MLSRYIFLFLSICSFSKSGLAQQDASLPPNAEAGKCYAKCSFEYHSSDDSIGYNEKTYPIYIGIDPNVKTRNLKITIQAPKQTWVKQKGKRKCESVERDDCIVWCLVETAFGIYETITIAKRPKKVPEEDITYETFQIPYPEYPGKTSLGTRAWRQVLCESQINSQLFDDIAEGLWKKGYDMADKDYTTMSEIKNALIHYQKNNDLPIGALDLESLKSLNVKY